MSQDWLATPDAAQIQARLAALERRDLDEGAATRFGPLFAPQAPARMGFVRVDGLASFWESDTGSEGPSLEHSLEDLATGLHSASATWVFVLISERNRLSLYTGLRSDAIEPVRVLSASLLGAFPDISFHEVQAAEVATLVAGRQNCSGIVTGIPSVEEEQPTGTLERIERLVRGIYGTECGLMVVAEPLQETDVQSMIQTCSDEIMRAHTWTKRTVQVPGAYGQATSVEAVDRLIQHYAELLETQLGRTKVGLAQGMWQVGAYAFAASEDAFQRAKALIHAAFSGAHSLPQPIRVIRLDDARRAIAQYLQIRNPFDGQHPLGQHFAWKFLTALNSREVALLAQFPRMEMPGYKIRQYARFDVSPPEGRPSDGAVIGRILDVGRETGNAFVLDVADLTRHGLITGMTGSGKTNTCLAILDQLWRGRKIPFLVIEPAKVEDYRHLFATPGFEESWLFTVGHEMVGPDRMAAPFRLNPFEPVGRTPLQKHLDLLRSVFNASFVMYAPMPYVLERCLHEVYRDKGWDLASNVNRFGEVIYPTLRDLYDKVDEVVDQLGYEERIRMDVKAALKTRIGSLLVGGKGLMLDTRTSYPMDLLVSRPVILELSWVGDDDEKAFIMGLFLIRLYEYCETAEETDRLRHVTVVEEAHRLLANVPMHQASADVANTRGKAVEAFCNMLAELRAYGEGILVVEQSPTKLAVDAIRNTNLKVAHRLVWEDDREVMGRAMNMDPSHRQYLAILTEGRAAAHAEGLHRPFLLQVPYYKQRFKAKAPGDADIADAMLRRFYQAHSHILDQFEECGDCGARCRYRRIARELIEDGQVMRAFARFVLGVVNDAHAAVDTYDALVAELSRHTHGAGAQDGAALCTLVHSLNSFFDLKARFYRWHPRQAAVLRRILWKIMQRVARADRTTAAGTSALNASLTNGVAQFQQMYRQACARPPRLFAGCQACVSVCLYQQEIARLVGDAELENEVVASLTGSKQEAAARLAVAGLLAAQRAYAAGDGAFAKGAGLCFVVQKVSQTGKFTMEEQTSIAKQTWANMAAATRPQGSDA